MTDKVEIINYLFRSFNKDPYQHKDQVKHFLIECQDFDAAVVEKAVKQAIVEENYLPKAWIIVNKCKSQYEVKERKTEDCFLCNSMGLIFSPFHIDEEGNQTEIVSATHEPKSVGRYSTKIVGCCKCVNGEIYSSSYKSADPWPYIIDGAMDNKWDCVFQADCIAKEYNKVARGGNSSKKNNHFDKYGGR